MTVSLLLKTQIVLVSRKITALCNETSSSFALFNGEHGEGFVPYQSSPKFRIRDQDKSFLSNLREWMITYKFDDGKALFIEDSICNWLIFFLFILLLFMVGSCCFTSLKDIKEGEHLNLNCQVDCFWSYLSFYLRNWTFSRLEIMVF